MNLKRKHLIILAAMDSLGKDHPDWLFTFARIASRCEHMGYPMPLSEVRRIVRFLKRKELVWYSQTFTDELLTCGSGHALTKEGEIFIRDYLKNNTLSKD